MGNGESSPAEETPQGENVAAAIVRLKLAKAKGEMTQEQYDAGNSICLMYQTSAMRNERFR